MRGGDRRRWACEVDCGGLHHRQGGALAEDYPGYGFENHKGYAGPEHLEALDRLGPSVHHRSFFAPVIAAREKHYPSPAPADLFSLQAQADPEASAII